MRMHHVRKFFAILVSAPLFIFLAWFFGIFMQPQGEIGAGFALGLIAASALAALWVYGWLMRPGPKMRFRNRGVDGYDRDWGMGLTGYAGHKDGGRRRRDDDTPDDLGGRRSSGEMDGDADGLEGGSLA
ncbi:hypothetical protein [Maricaulis sp.]|uniref:hypothetical protein n=1 Tax=Maricaulis sp. TaxID=1486257 RepID=UPI00260D95C3|nr:hypothetical protein [Maricaulis sp.]